ncbi:hypothetical protein PFISCL1PPCAC_10210, partial [Pristionchus fissidentatus]
SSFSPPLSISLILSDKVSFFRVAIRRMVSTELSPIEKAKRDAAYACAQKHVQPGCKLGVGSGSTVKYLVEYLEQAYKSGSLNDIICVPTSFMTKKWLVDSGLPVSDLDSTPVLDVCIDGADEVDVDLTCIKGGGGCLAREKIVQHASKKFLVIADHTKEAVSLGDRYQFLPIEVLPFASTPVTLEIPRLFGGSAGLRMAVKKAGPVITDNGSYIIDWVFPKQKNLDWKAIQATLADTPGIVDTGLFIDVVDEVFFAYADGSVKTISKGEKTKK